MGVLKLGQLDKYKFDRNFFKSNPVLHNICESIFEELGVAWLIGGVECVWLDESYCMISYKLDFINKSFYTKNFLFDSEYKKMRNGLIDYLNWGQSFTKSENYFRCIQKPFAREEVLCNYYSYFLVGALDSLKTCTYYKKLTSEGLDYVEVQKIEKQAFEFANNPLKVTFPNPVLYIFQKNSNKVTICHLLSSGSMFTYYQCLEYAISRKNKLVTRKKLVTFNDLLWVINSKNYVWSYSSKKFISKVRRLEKEEIAFPLEIMKKIVSEWAYVKNSKTLFHKIV